MIGAYGAMRTSRRGGRGPAGVTRRAPASPGVLAAAVLLAACATEPLGPGRAALSDLVGRPEAELIRRLGPPVHVSELQGVRTLTYEARDVTRLRGSFAIPPRTASFRCDTVVVVAEGRVRAFDSRGNGCGG